MRVLLLTFALTCALFAQVDRGNIQAVTDPTGGVVAGASVRIVSTATNIAQSTSTGPNGTYAFFNLPIGLYNLSVEGNGFRRADVNGVQVEVNQQAKVDVALQVGEVTQTVEVQASASLVQTESTDVGEVLDNKRFTDLPLTLGGGIRNPSSFIYLSPGVTPGGNWETHRRRWFL
jgi:carboxypeptidase family protein